MSENPPRPREYDVVLGGQNLPPVHSAVLGGIEGVKRRLENTDIEQKVAALEDALKYGEAGLDLAIQALQSELDELKWAAYSLLHRRQAEKVKQALQKCNLCLRTLRHDSAIKFVAISKDGKMLISGSQTGSIKWWDLQTQPMRRTLYDFNSIDRLNVNSFGSGNGRYFLNQVLKIWDLRLDNWYRKNVEAYKCTVFSLAISPDGKKIVCGDTNDTINVWDLNARTFPPRKICGQSRYSVQTLAFSSNGKTLVSGSNDKTIKAWDFETGKLTHIFKDHSDGVTAVAISPDGQTIVSSSQDNTVKVWNLQTKKLQRTLKGHLGSVYCVAISLDGSTVISGGRDTTIRVWNLYTGECQRILEGHTNWVYCLALSPDGNTLVSGDKDETIRVWRLPQGFFSY